MNWIIHFWRGATKQICHNYWRNGQLNTFLGHDLQGEFGSQWAPGVGARMKGPTVNQFFTSNSVFSEKRKCQADDYFSPFQQQ